MKILVHAIHYPVCSARYFVDALRRLGYDVRHDGAEAGREIWGLTLAAEYEWKPEPAEDGWTPDLCILMDTAYQWHHPTVPTVIYSVDNHVRDLRQPGISHYFLAHRNVSKMDWHITVEETGEKGWYTNMTHLPCAYDPVAFTPSQIPYTERKYDVCLLGMFQGYPHRMQAVRELQAAGLKVAWGCGLVYDAYAAVHHDSRIALSLSIRGDVGQRIFESAALGCAVLSDPCADFDILQPEGITILDPGKPLVEQVRAVLEQPLVAETAIAKALEWVQSGHSWDERCKVVLKWVEEQNRERQGVI